jgi:hypothetical protein
MPVVASTPSALDNFLTVDGGDVLAFSQTAQQVTNTYVPLLDAMGSTLALVDGSGNLVNTSFSALDAARDDRGGRRASFLCFADCAGVGVAGRDLVFAFTWFSFSGRGFGATGRREHTLLCSADMGRRPAWRAVGPRQIASG